MVEQPICIGIFALIGCVLFLLLLRIKRLSDLANDRLKTLQQEYPRALIRHYYGSERCSVTRIGDNAPDSWTHLVLLIADADVGLHPIELRPRDPFRVAHTQIRWFG